MEIRKLVIDIPKPDKDGFCSTECPLRHSMDKCLNKLAVPTKWRNRFWLIKPGKDCPWKEE